jgi:hypothetical protein
MTALPLVVLLAHGSSNARADVVSDWNIIASDTIVTAITAGRPGPPTSLDFAIVHDAIQAFEKRFKPYHVQIHAAAGSPSPISGPTTSLPSGTAVCDPLRVSTSTGLAIAHGFSPWSTWRSLIP